MQYILRMVDFDKVALNAGVARRLHSQLPLFQNIIPALDAARKPVWCCLVLGCKVADLALLVSQIGYYYTVGTGTRLTEIRFQHKSDSPPDQMARCEEMVQQLSEEVSSSRSIC